MKTRKLVREYSTIALGSGIMGGLGAMPGVPAGVTANAMTGMQLASTGVTIGAAGGLMRQMEMLGKRRKR